MPSPFGVGPRAQVAGAVDAPLLLGDEVGLGGATDEGWVEEVGRSWFGLCGERKVGRAGVESGPSKRVAWRDVSWAR